MLSEKLRKAALLVSTLDTRSADSLLDQLPAECAARVRAAMMSLPVADPREQDRVIHEFLNCHGPNTRPSDGPSTRPCDGGVELDQGLIEKMAAARSSAAVGESRHSVPFQFLHEAAADDLGRLLRHEHPQIAAVVMSHLTPRKSADILATFPAHLQTAVLRRIADLDAADPDVIRDLEAELQTRLVGRLSGSRAAGIRAVWEIVQAAETLDRKDILRNLNLRDRKLANQLTRSGVAEFVKPTSVLSTGSSPDREPRPLGTPGISPGADATPRGMRPSEEVAVRSTASPLDDRSNEAESDRPIPGDRLDAPVVTMTFDDVMRLDDRELARLFRAAEPQITLLALAGAQDEFVRRLLSQLPAKEAKTVRRRISEMRPLLLSDVDTAQRQLARVAGALAQQGEVNVPRPRGFAAAA